MGVRRRRVGAYGVCRDATGAVLLTRASRRSVRPGTWYLPGGGVEPGEDPAGAVVREVAEETGLTATVAAPRAVYAEVVYRPPDLEHTDGVIYDLTVTGGRLRPERGGSTDAVRWVPPAELPALPVSALAGYALELPVVPAAPAVPVLDGGRDPRPSQRFAAYGLVTDPAGRVLLTRIADGYPGAGLWHLPGGGTDFGEQPAAGLCREIEEESGQRAEVGRLLTVTHRRDGPRPAVRAVYRAAVAEPTRPRVLEIAGSTGAAGWFPPAEARALPLTDVAAATLTGCAGRAGSGYR